MKKFLFLIFLSFSSIFASPQDPTVVSGTVNFTQEKNKLNIFSSDDSLIINWKNFDIQKDETVQFFQPTCDSFVLNRVTGLDKTKIFGTLLSNGSIFLINPNGIFTSKDAKIDVGSLLFSTLSLKDDDFLNNKDSLSFINESDNHIENFADIKSKKDVYLISKKVENFGNIEAQSGNILVGSGNNILIKPKESESLFILCDLSENFEKKQDVGINLKGDIKANRVEIKADGNLYELAIKQNSNIEAVSLCKENGKIYLKAANGNVSIDNSSLTAKKEFKGGEILITANRIEIDNSKIDVSHKLDGGNIYIGGKKQGLDKNVQNAKETFVGKNVFIDAGSENLGSGGEVIVWSDDTTNFYGTIYSKGGRDKGNGGFVEVSGKNNLSYAGFVNTEALNGKTGTLLLDPTDITISAAADAFGGGGFDALDPNVYTPGIGVNPNNISVATLQTNLTSTDVIINTASAGANPGNITFGTGAALTLTMTGDGHTLTLNADNNIIIANPTTFNFPLNGNGQIQFNAANDIVFNQSFTCNNATQANFIASNTITTPTAVAKTIAFTNASTINLSGTLGITIANNTATATTFNFGAAFNVNITSASGNITLGNTTTGVTTLQAGSNTTLSMSAVDIIFQPGTATGNGGVVLNTFKEINFTASNDISHLPLGTNITTFLNDEKINYTAANGIIIGQNNTAFSTTVNYGVAKEVNMVTTGVNTDITFGGASSGIAIINGSFATTMNVNPTGAINFSGIAAGTTTFNSFGTINLFSATTTPTATNLINFTRPTITFSGINNLMMYPYNLSFTTTAFNIIGPNNLFLIKTTDPSGTIIPDTLNMNLSNMVNLEIEAEDLTIRGRILNALGSGHIYLTSENDINIDATTIANSARVGTFNGDVKINCLNNLNVLAGSLLNSFAQIGAQGTNVNSDIYLNVQNDVNITGGGGIATILNHYAAIGHGMKTPLQGTHQGNIIIELIGGDLNITGGGTQAIPASESGARLGHGGLDLSSASASIIFSGDIRGTAAGSRAVVNGDINITGGWGDQCFAQIGHGASTATGASSTIQLLGNILIQCNNLNMVTQNNLVAATFEMFAGIGHKIRYAASNLSSLIDSGGVDVKVLNDATMTAAGNGGAVFLGAYINNSGVNTSTGSIDLEFVNFDVNNNLLVQGSTTLAAQENKAIIGVYSDLVASYTRSSLNVNVGNEFNFISNTGDSCFLISGQTPTSNRQTIVSVGGNFNFLGGQKTLSLKAIDTLDLTVNKNLNFQCNSSLSTEFASIESENTMNINVGGDLRISGNAQTSPPSTDFGFAFIRNNSLTSGDMTILIGKSLSMNPFSKLSNMASSKALTIVSDNNYPNRWDRGAGGVDLSLNTFFLTNSGPIRVFTVDQSQNVISNVAVNYPSFNGNKFTPGTAYQDTAQEIWGEYYPSSLSGFPFTFFYKTSGPTDVLEILEQKNNIFIPFFELFYRRFARFFDITNEYYDKHSEE